MSDSIRAAGKSQDRSRFPIAYTSRELGSVTGRAAYAISLLPSPYIPYIVDLQLLLVHRRTAGTDTSQLVERAPDFGGENVRKKTSQCANYRNAFCELKQDTRTSRHDRIDTHAKD